MCNVDELTLKVRRCLDFLVNTNPKAIEQLIIEIQDEIARLPSSGKKLGPQIAKLKQAQKNLQTSRLAWEPVGNGSIAIGSRPKGRVYVHCSTGIHRTGMIGTHS